MSNSKKKVALITGGSRGIGKACAMELAKHGHNIAFTYFSSEKRAINTKKQIEKQGTEVIYIKVDISNNNQIKNMVDQVLKKFGQIDVLVNNAGVSEIKKIEDINEKDWDLVLDTNLKGTFFCTQLVMDYMKKRKTGRIINMASQAGTTGGVFIGAHYSVSKGGVICLTKTFAKIGARYGVLVNCVSPGLIETDMLDSFPDKSIKEFVKTIPLGRLGKPEEVAKTVAFLASDHAKYITGANIPVNGGMLML